MRAIFSPIFFRPTVDEVGLSKATTLETKAAGDSLPDGYGKERHQEQQQRCRAALSNAHNEGERRPRARPRGRVIASRFSSGIGIIRKLCT